MSEEEANKLLNQVAEEETLEFETTDDIANELAFDEMHRLSTAIVVATDICRKNQEALALSDWLKQAYPVLTGDDMMRIVDGVPLISILAEKQDVFSPTDVLSFFMYIGHGARDGEASSENEVQRPVDGGEILPVHTDSVEASVSPLATED